MSEIQPYTPPALNTTTTLVIENFSFGRLSREALVTLYRDGRISAHFMEVMLAQDFGLTRIEGCKDHDLVDPSDPTIRYEEKTFTRGGCKFVPSNMLGQGRHFDQLTFEKKASGLIYAIVSVVNFPEIKIRFVKGTDLMAVFPRGEIKLSQHDSFFTDTVAPDSAPHSPLT
jgi:hypothetical protein